MSVSFQGVKELYVTFLCPSALTAGVPVKLVSNGTVDACADGERFVGIAAAVAEDGHAMVQIGGYAELGYTGAAPTAGWAHLVSGSNGAVKADAAGTTGGEYLVVSTDTSAGTVGIIL